MPDHHENGLIPTDPLEKTKIFQLSPKISEQLKAKIGEFEGVLFLKNNGDYVSFAVSDANPLIRIDGCSGKVELFKPAPNVDLAVAELQPETTSPENDELIKQLLTRRTHSYLIPIAYAAHNKCINVGGSRIYV